MAFSGIVKSLMQLVRRCLTVGGIVRLSVTAAVVYGIWRVMNSPMLWIHTVEIRGPVEATGLQEVKEAVTENIHGNILTVDIEAVKKAVQSIPWIKSVEVTRLWPDSLYVNVVRHRAVAIFDDGRLVSDDGILFISQDEPIDNLVKLPTFGGDSQYVAEMVRVYPAFLNEVKKIGARIKAVEVTFRGSWSVVIESEDFDSMTIELGRALSINGPLLRLSQVVENFERVCGMMQGWPDRIDARYRNAFAAKLPDAENQKLWKKAVARKEMNKKAKASAQSGAKTSESGSPQVTTGQTIDLSGGAKP